MRWLLLFGLLFATAVHAVEVSQLQWRVAALVSASTAITFAPRPSSASMYYDPVTDAPLPFSPPKGCVIALRSAHLAAKDRDRGSYLVVLGITSVSRDAPMLMDPPYLSSQPLNDIGLINNADFPQWMIGVVTGYLICGIPPGEEANAWVLANEVIGQ